MAFPASPDKGEQYIVGDVTWEYFSDSNSWKLLDWQNFGGVSIEVFIDDGTWTKPKGAKIVHVTAIGAGAVGGTDGGGGGGLTSAFFDASLLGSTVPVTVYSSSIFSTLKAGLGDGNSGGYGKYNGASGGIGGINDAGTPVDGASGTDSYGGASGGAGQTLNQSVGDIEFIAYGGAGGGSPLYSTTSGSAGNDLPIPGGATPENAAGSYGSGGAGGAPGGGVVIVKVWYAWA